MHHLLNYGMVTHLMLNISKCKKIDVKSDQGIFLGYSTRSKSYKCLNTNTNKVVESANVKFEEHVEVQNNESTKKPKE